MIPSRFYLFLWMCSLKLLWKRCCTWKILATSCRQMSSWHLMSFESVGTTRNHATTYSKVTLVKYWTYQRPCCKERCYGPQLVCLWPMRIFHVSMIQDGYCNVVLAPQWTLLHEWFTSNFVTFNPSIENKLLIFTMSWFT